jgi:hypothetical protein
MSHLGFPETHESPIGDALRRIRLRHDVPRLVGSRWFHVSVKQRAAHQARELAGTKRRRDDPKRWQPAEGRESPREEWMSWRHSFTHYAFPGWMRFNHGKGPALVGRALLYCPSSSRAHYAHRVRTESGT